MSAEPDPTTAIPERPDITRLLDERLVTAISNRCTHPARSTQFVDDPRFGEQCADCLAMAHDLIKIVDDFGAENGRSATRSEVETGDSL